jgi:hypothetical protein
MGDYFLDRLFHRFGICSLAVGRRAALMETLLDLGLALALGLLVELWLGG